MFPLRVQANLFLELATGHDGGLLLVDNLAIIPSATSLDSLYNILGLFVRDFAKDDVTAIQPGRLDGRDEELGAVAVEKKICQRKLPGKSYEQIRVVKLTCWGQHWPWRAERGVSASA
jgi:hypothetical protein